MRLPSLKEIRAAQEIVYRHMRPTPQYAWPLLCQRLGTETWVKHENHAPTGAFKIRGALVYLDWLTASRPGIVGVVAATRGNHGQGVAMAAKAFGLKAKIVAPCGNSVEKNRAMCAQGAELIEYGHDFQAALDHARTIAAEEGLALVESFHERLVMGTATYATEFFEAVPELDAVYVPIGLGSSICGMAAARNALGRKTAIIGVAAAASPAYARSFRERRVVEAPAQSQIADGLACRVPNQDSLAIILAEVERVVEVSEAEIRQAMRAYYEDTHNLAEGAGAAALAGALRERDALRGRRIGVILSGGNVDRVIYAGVLNESLSEARIS
ncbi:MAG: threonine dehydratase [Acidobacteriota bacterium]